jgi:hypothetical protein
LFNKRSNDFKSLVEHSYRLLGVFSHFNYTSYLNPMIIHLLHLLYWNEVSHPALHFVKYNPICIDEEIGELSLSLLANKLSATKICKNFKNLQNDFLGLAFIRKLEKDYIKKFNHQGTVLFCLNLSLNKFKKFL